MPPIEETEEQAFKIQSLREELQQLESKETEVGHTGGGEGEPDDNQID